MLTADELTDARADATATLGDVCNVQTPAFTTDAHGQPIPAYEDGADLACGLRLVSAKDTWQQADDGSGVSITVTAVLRLPAGTVVPVDGRIKVTKHHGETLSTPLLFSVVGRPRGDLLSVVLDLTSVDGV